MNMKISAEICVGKSAAGKLFNPISPSKMACAWFSLCISAFCFR